jgi:hypothetical protein
MSEANSDWFLRHRDGVEHGPFQLAELITAARAGNIASDTVLRHEVHSHDQWVFATRVQPVAQAMTRPKGQSTQQPTKAAASPTPQQTPSPAQPQPAVRPQPAVPRPPAAQLQADAQRNEPAADTATTSISAVPSLQPASLRSLHGNAFPVPKTFFDALLALFDFRFQRFVTPWIIQFLWATTVLLAILCAATLAYTMLIGPTMPSPDEMSATDRGSWQFDPLAGRSFLQSDFFRFTLALFSLSLILLGIRVLCEGAIIFFRVAIDIRELKGTLREREK